MTKKLDELNQDHTPTPPEEIEQWYKDWEVLSTRLDQRYKEIMDMFGIVREDDENK